MDIIGSVLREQRWHASPNVVPIVELEYCLKRAFRIPLPVLRDIEGWGDLGGGRGVLMPPSTASSSRGSTCICGRTWSAGRKAWAGNARRDRSTWRLVVLDERQDPPALVTVHTLTEEMSVDR